MLCMSMNMHQRAYASMQMVDGLFEAMEVLRAATTHEIHP
jgi:hypothetical protein